MHGSGRDGSGDPAAPGSQHGHVVVPHRVPDLVDQPYEVVAQLAGAQPPARRLEAAQPHVDVLVAPFDEAVGEREHGVAGTEREVAAFRSRPPAPSSSPSVTSSCSGSRRRAARPAAGCPALAMTISSRSGSATAYIMVTSWSMSYCSNSRSSLLITAPGWGPRR